MIGAVWRCYNPGVRWHGCSSGHAPTDARIAGSGLKPPGPLLCVARRSFLGKRLIPTALNGAAANPMLMLPDSWPWWDPNPAACASDRVFARRPGSHLFVFVWLLGPLGAALFTPITVFVDRAGERELSRHVLAGAAADQREEPDYAYIGGRAV